MSTFRYLGAAVNAHGELLKDVEDTVAFGAFCRPVFHGGDLSLKTKRMVHAYRAAVLGVLLYGAETWTNKKIATQKIESFHNKYH